MTPDYPLLMGFFMRDSEVVRLKSGNREVLERDETTGAPLRVRVTARVVDPGGKAASYSKVLTLKR